jgi:hypothetical protein
MSEWLFPLAGLIIICGLFWFNYRLLRQRQSQDRRYFVDWPGPCG